MPALDLAPTCKHAPLSAAQPTVFDKRNISLSELDLERGAVVGGTELDCLALKVDAGFAILQDVIDHVLDLR